jgi:hypothetical protein
VWLDHPTRGFELPAGLFTVLEAMDGRVIRLVVTPHVGYLDEGATLVLLESLHQRIQHKGWFLRRLRLGRTTLVARLPRTDEERVALYQHGSWRAEIRVRREIRGGTPRAAFLKLDGDAYLVTLILWDGKADAQ